MSKSKFQTIVDIPDFKWRTGYKKRNMFMGSCFTENIGQIMSGLKYNVDVNPFGILYNPLSVANGFRILLEKRLFTQSDLIQQNGLWHSFSHHGDFSSEDETEALKKINTRISNSSVFFQKTDFLFITFGTAWVYKLAKTGEIVSNCHKIPAKKFIRERLSVKEIVDTYSELLLKIWEQNTQMKVIFTVSPIRHWKDGAVENQRSKATLLLAVSELQNCFSERCAYFPSYEIIMDELRDYRFYASDMIHLSEVAVNHVWERFEEQLCDVDSIRLSKEIIKINNAVKHRPIKSKSSEYQQFIKLSLNKIADLEQRFPYLDFLNEKCLFNEQIDKNQKLEDNT